MTQKKLAIALLAAMPVLAGASSLSAEDTDMLEDEVIELEDAYVRPDYVEIERLRQTKEILVISKEAIEQKGNRTLSDVLAKTPSVSVEAAGHGVIDIRGMGTGQAQRNVQVYMDGMPISPLTTHPYQTDFNVIPVEEIERIEVIPGGSSVLYGSGTAGGVVNITSTMKNLKEPTQTVSGEWNSEGYRLNASVGSKLSDKFTVQASASKLERDLYFVDSWKDSEYYSAALRWDLTKDQTLILRGSYLEEDSELYQNIRFKDVEKYGKYAPVKSDWATSYQLSKLRADREQKQYSLSYINDISDKLHWVNDIFYADGWITGNADGGTMYNDGYGIRSSLEWSYGDGSSLLVGFNYANQNADLDYSDLDYGLQHFYYDKEMWAIFATNTFKWNNWDFVQGMRHERNTWGFDKSLKRAAFAGERETDNNAFELAAAYHYRDSGKIYARYERGFTLPDGVFISDERVENGVYGLYPAQADDEKFDMFEIGLSDKIGFTTVSLTAWISQTDNQLDRLSWLDRTTLKRSRVTMNLVDTQRHGVDLSLIQQFGDLTLEESYSYLRGRSKYISQAAEDFVNSKLNADMSFSGGGLQSVPEHKFTVSADYAFTDNFSANLRYTYTGEYKNFGYQKDAAEGATVGAYNLVDLSFKFQPYQWLSIHGGINNVFDEEYFEWGMDHAGGTGDQMIVPGAERSFFIGMKATY